MMSEPAIHSKSYIMHRRRGGQAAGSLVRMDSIPYQTLAYTRAVFRELPLPSPPPPFLLPNKSYDVFNRYHRRSRKIPRRRGPTRPSRWPVSSAHTSRFNQAPTLEYNVFRTDRTGATSRQAWAVRTLSHLPVCIAKAISTTTTGDKPSPPDGRMIIHAQV